MSKIASSVAFVGNNTNNQTKLGIHASLVPNGSIELLTGPGNVLLTIPADKRAELAELIANAE